ncbi:MAG: M20/M25/M40 family metallo-hydrolase [Faecousia sp.]
MQEFRTARRIEEELDRLEIPHVRVGETGVLGTIRGSGGGGGVVVLRADIDALPIQETSGAEYRSATDGVMHACGHDAHGACLRGAARLLSRQRREFGGIPAPCARSLCLSGQRKPGAAKHHEPRSQWELRY